MVRLDQTLSSWKSIREDTAQAVEDFSAHDLDYKPIPELGSFGEIARHILVASYALTGMLLDEFDDLTSPEFRGRLGLYAAQVPKTEGTGALANELRKVFESRSAELAAKPAAFYAAEMTRTDGQRVTRLEMLQTIKEHELTHRSQLFMYLRLKGMVPPTTRRRMAKAKA